MIPAIGEAARQLRTGQREGEGLVVPDGRAGPVPVRWHNGQNAAVDRAAECDRAVGNGEDVLPERIARPEFLDGPQIVRQARLDVELDQLLRRPRDIPGLGLSRRWRGE